MYHVAYCFDAKYQQHFAASLASLVDNFSADPANLTIHIITDSAEERLTRFVTDFAARTNIAIEIHNLTQDHIGLPDTIPEKSRNMKGYLGLAAYFRIMIPLMLGEEVEKVLYLDSDTIVVTDIIELLSIDLEGKAIAAALDVDHRKMAQAHSLPHYYNSGVMLMDLPALRAQAFSKRCFDYQSDHDNKSLMADQCVINIVLDGAIKALPRKWNRYVSDVDASRLGADEVLTNAAIIHFITADKPWQAWYANKVGDLYWASLRTSQWPNPITGQPKTVNDYHRLAQKRAADGQHMEAISLYETLVAYLRKTCGQERAARLAATA